MITLLLLLPTLDAVPRLPAASDTLTSPFILGTPTARTLVGNDQGTFSPVLQLMPLRHVLTRNTLSSPSPVSFQPNSAVVRKPVA